MKKFLAILAALPLIAAATEFNAVETDKSRIGFVSKQMGVPVDGRFGKFSARIAFDPARPEAGRASIEIELAGVDAGSRDANEELKDKNWFDVARFPKATFVSTRVRTIGPGRYEAKGRMTIKGTTREVAVPFTYRPEGAHAVLQGEMPIRRTQFGIGAGIWADTDTVADEVRINFSFHVAAGGKQPSP